MQVVAGTNHILHLETSDDAGKKDVEVTVWEKLPANVQANESPLQLTGSKLLGGPVAEVRTSSAQALLLSSAQTNGCEHACSVVCMDVHSCNQLDRLWHQQRQAAQDTSCTVCIMQASGSECACAVN